MNDYASTIVGPGALLVATPDMKDPHFARSDSGYRLFSRRRSHGPHCEPTTHGGPNGCPIPIASWMESSQSPSTIFLGGPVEPNGYICMTPDQTSLSGLRSVDIESISPIHLDGPHRVFRGYSGWGAGQLEDELAFKSWFVVPSLSSDAMTTTPATLWNEVLQRQSGPLRRLGLFPINPEAN